MLHILLGDSAGDPQLLLGAAAKGSSLEWVVPKSSRVGDDALFHLPAEGFVVRGKLSSDPSPEERKGWYRATIENLALLPTFVPLAFVRDSIPDWKWPTYPRHYTTIDGIVEARLKELLGSYDSAAERLLEGAPTSITITTYERNPIARQKCLQHYGTSCFVCGFSFEEKYGETVAGYIHVHHIKSVAARGGEYLIDPVEDLRPVCPNCHAVLHLKNPALGIEDVKNMLEEA